MKQIHINGLETMPVLGLGTWKSTRDEVGPAVSAALKIGYRHFDCASIYNNEKEIGTALATALKTGQITREQLWISSKLWNNAHAAKHVRPALERTLKNLQLDHLDLYLIHWPVSFRADITFPKRPDQFISPEQLPIIETWRAMEKMVKKGLCRHIGVCNFSLKRLKALKDLASIQPYTNQIELHPYLQQPEMVEYCSKNSVQLTAYSPLGSGKIPDRENQNNFVSLLNHPKILHLATIYDVSPAQILIAWALTRKTAVIPKSVHPRRLEENYKAQQIVIDSCDMKQIDQIDLGHRFLDGAYFAPAGSPYNLANLWDE
ncbi:MAG: alcohol dehydrogenase (NADP+) [Desulforhopalus sp.]|jgi:alcohol dehydrogenase (NADP+)